MKELTYLGKKRFKLLAIIIIIPLSIFIISFFVHDLMLTPYTKSQMEILTKWFKAEIYDIIRKEIQTGEERKILWELADKESINKINTNELLKYYRVFYIIVAIFIFMLTAILVKWYMTNNEDIFISDELKKIKKG